MQREEGPKGLAAGLRAGEQIVEGCFRNRRYVRRCTPRETKVRLEEGPKAWAATPQQRLLHHSSGCYTTAAAATPQQHESLWDRQRKAILEADESGDADHLRPRSSLILHCLLRLSV